MKRENGFTLIELMIVVAIIGTLASLVMGSFGGGVGIYGYLNSKDVSGRLESVSSAMPAGAIIGANSGGAPVYQASVMIRQADGILISFSTEDRQWASFEGDKAKGKCATARIYPYAPWEISKAGTFHGGRLLVPSDCK